MNFDDEFQKALIKYIKPFGRGGQARVCDKTGLPSTVISAIVRGARPASEQNKHRIANALGFTYDEFRTFGRDEKITNNLLPMRRLSDHDRKFRELEDSIKEIWDGGNPEHREWLTGTIDLFLKTNKLIKPPGKRAKG
jgi:hypothetical protein